MRSDDVNTVIQIRKMRVLGISKTVSLGEMNVVELHTSGTNKRRLTKVLQNNLASRLFVQDDNGRVWWLRWAMFEGTSRKSIAEIIEGRTVKTFVDRILVKSIDAAAASPDELPLDLNMWA